MPSVRIGNAESCLNVHVPEPEFDSHRSGCPTEIQAELRLGELNARVHVLSHYATGFADLVSYFDGLERDWRGWSSVRRWQSPEHELTLEARHDGHVRIQVELARMFWWTACGELTVEPGEMLSQAAAGLRRAFAAT